MLNYENTVKLLIDNGWLKEDAERRACFTCKEYWDMNKKEDLIRKEFMDKVREELKDE